MQPEGPLLCSQEPSTAHNMDQIIPGHTTPS
jgi:hypothetical protein